MTHDILANVRYNSELTNPVQSISSTFFPFSSSGSCSLRSRAHCGGHRTVSASGGCGGPAFAAEGRRGFLDGADLQHQLGGLQQT